MPGDTGVMTTEKVVKLSSSQSILQTLKYILVHGNDEDCDVEGGGWTD